MQATTARGTDAERTEEAAPVAVENVLVDAAARVVLEDKDVGLEVICELSELSELRTLVLLAGAVTADELVTGATDTDELGRTDGRVGAGSLSVPGITLGNVSVFPPSLHKNSSENQTNVISRMSSRGTYVAVAGVETVGPCGRAMTAAATARRVKN